MKATENVTLKLKDPLGSMIERQKQQGEKKIKNKKTRGYLLGPLLIFFFFKFKFESF